MPKTPSRNNDSVSSPKRHKSTTTSSVSSSSPSSSQSKITTLFEQQKLKAKDKSSPLSRPEKESFVSSLSKDDIMTLQNMPAFPGVDLKIGAQSSPPKVGRMLLKNQTRKLIIKSVATSEKNLNNSATKYYDETSHKLALAIDSILHSKSTNISQEELYRGVENLCRYDKASPLWKMCYEKLESYISQVITRDLEEAARSTSAAATTTTTNTPTEENESRYLKRVYNTWTDWSTKVTLIRNIFYYLDRSFLFATSHRKPIWDTGAYLFSTHIVNNEVIGPYIASQFENLLKYFRTSERDMIEIDVLSNFMRMLSNFKFDFAQYTLRLIGSCETFCMEMTKVDAENIEEFLDQVKHQVEIESGLVKHLKVSSNTQTKLTLTIKKSMVSGNHETLFKGLWELLDSNKSGACKDLFELAKPVEEAQRFVDEWKEYIKTRAHSIMQGSFEVSEHGFTHSAIFGTLNSNGNKVVFNLIKLYLILSSILKDSCSNDEDLKSTLRDSFTEVFNQSETISETIAEKIARYCDVALRMPVVGTDDEQVLEQQLDLAIGIFRFVRGKDMFEAFYKKDFAKRLLQNKSRSQDAERGLLSRLKAECGAQFTQKLETMLKDMVVSKEHMQELKLSSRRIQFNVNVLTQGHWPTFPDVSATIPSNLQKYLQEYEDHYMKSSSGRKLTWKHNLGNCVVKMNLPNGSKELTVSLLQSLVLLQFNADDETVSKGVSYAEIKESTGIQDDQVLQRTLQSLACAKIKILLKEPKSKTVSENDMFFVNFSLKEKSYRLKINQLHAKSRGEENNNEEQDEIQQTRKGVIRDRQMEVQAAIIRIMKSRKELKHVELIQQTIQQTIERGALDVADIKKNIDRLIDKEFLERVGTDSYRYI